jgi:Trypsin-like peptidase domain
MFSRAYQVVKNFTRPVATSWRTLNGDVKCGLATFVVVNSDGWIVTAAHVLEISNIHAKHAIEKQAYETRRADIAADLHLSSSQRKKRHSQNVPDPGWITDYSFWWCQDRVTVSQAYVDAQADVAIAKLDNFDTSTIQIYPKFHDPAADPPPACSVCRLGFPFVTVTATFDAATGFTLQNFVLPPMFPNDGIHTRIFADTQGSRTVKFVETSTPGLRGQSGGPLFDVNGGIWGIQSRTSFLELGFTPKKIDGKKEIIEHQFMNVGLASHVKHAIDLFRQYNVPYESV